MELLDKQEAAGQIEDFLQGVVRSLDLDLEMEIQAGDGEISVEFFGDDSEMLLTENARLLYALNHLVNQIFFRRCRERLSFVLDCNRYRKDRISELELMARKAAEQARVSRRKISLQPMPSSERRIIHLALAEEPGIRTESEGSGWRRRVLIVPA